MVHGARMQVTMVLYALSILFLLFLALFIWRNCQFGIGSSLMLLLVILFLYFIIAIVMALALVLLRDGCHHMERIAMQEVRARRGAVGEGASSLPLGSRMATAQTRCYCIHM
jgi:hypothetical protein